MSAGWLRHSHVIFGVLMVAQCITFCFLTLLNLLQELDTVKLGPGLLGFASCPWVSTHMCMCEYVTCACSIALCFQGRVKEAKLLTLSFLVFLVSVSIMRFLLLIPLIPARCCIRKKRMSSKSNVADIASHSSLQWDNSGNNACLLCRVDIRIV